MGRSSPYYGDIWSTYCSLTSFFTIVNTCLSCEDTARQSCAMVPMAIFEDIFCVMYFRRAVCSTFQTCILNSHWQRAPPMFGRAVITLGIGPHSISVYVDRAMDKQTSSAFDWSYLQQWAQHCQYPCSRSLAEVRQLCLLAKLCTQRP